MWSIPDGEGVGNVVVRLDGTDAHWATPDAPINTGPDHDSWQLHPDWSRDGSQLAYVIDDLPNGRRDIWVSNADGSGTRRVFDCVVPCDIAEFPAWSSDGESILFVRMDHADGMSDGSLLQVVDLDTGEVTTLAQTDGADYFAYPRWSPDGRRIVTQIETWTNITEDSELVSTSVAMVDLADSPATITRLTDPGEWAGYPDWHPTDDRIVYSRRPADGSDRYDLYTMATDGSEIELLVDDRRNAVQPTWLPDGSGVIFVLVSGDDYTTAQMWAVGADGSGLRPATATEQALGGSHPRLRPLP